MPKKQHTPEQIISMLRQIKVEQANGKAVAEGCRAAGITVHTIPFAVFQPGKSSGLVRHPFFARKVSIR